MNQQINTIPLNGFFQSQAPLIPYSLLIDGFYSDILDLDTDPFRVEGLRAKRVFSTVNPFGIDPNKTVVQEQ